MLNNGPSVAGLYIASAAPTNISTVEFKCLLNKLLLPRHCQPISQKKKRQLSPLPVQLVVGINDYKTY